MRTLTRNRLKRTVNTFLTDTCTIEKETVGRDVYGASAPGWALVASGVACRLITAGQNSSSQAKVQADQEVMRDVFKLVLPAGQDIGVNYRVTHNSAVYGVVGIENDLTDELFTQVLVERARGDV